MKHSKIAHHKVTESEPTTIPSDFNETKTPKQKYSIKKDIWPKKQNFSMERIETI